MSILQKQLKSGGMPKTMNDERELHGQQKCFVCNIGKRTDKRRGGNGQVFPAWNKNASDATKYVVKFFCVSVQKPWNRKKRYNRFKNEIKKVSELQNQINGIVPVVDFYFPEDCPDDDYSAWYVMPRAELFNVCDHLSIRNKLSQMLELANILRQLHERGYAHRDIKPENILLFDGKVFLADFGLIWFMEDECHYTSVDEEVGPLRILPPEMRRGDAEKLKSDQLSADVYLFAKVIWMYLNENNDGFMGEYDCSSTRYYFSGLVPPNISFEPMHELLAHATKDSWNERISIAKCISLLEEQIRLLDDNVPLNLMNHYRFMEKTRLLRKGVVPKGIFFDDIDIVANTLNTIATACTFMLVGKETNLMVNSVKVVGEGILRLQYSLNHQMFFGCEGRMSNMQVLNDNTYILILLPITKPSDDYEPFGKKAFDMCSLSGMFYIAEPSQIEIKEKTLC